MLAHYFGACNNYVRHSSTAEALPESQDLVTEMHAVQIIRTLAALNCSLQLQIENGGTAEVARVSLLCGKYCPLPQSGSF